MSAIRVGVILVVCFLTLGGPSRAAASPEGVSLRANASASDSELIVSVFVGTSPQRTCRGHAFHDHLSLALPQLRTSDTGNGRWQWHVGSGVPGGHWLIKATCQLSFAPVTNSASFTATHGPQGHGKSGGLLEPGTMTATSFTPTASTGGRGGGEGENGYPKGQCTWWARLKRPDIPVFPGPAGDAKNWAESASKADPKFQIGQVAKPGAIVVFQPDQDGAGEYGHVAYVERVLGSRMRISEANFAGTKPGHMRTLRWRGEHLQFIYQRAPQNPVQTPIPAGSFRFYVFRTCANGDCELLGRQAPSSSAPPSGLALEQGDPVDITCQTSGDRVTGFDATSTDVWDKLADGSFVSDYYVDTPGKNDQYSVPIQRCGTDSGAGPETVPPPHQSPTSLALSGVLNGSIVSGPLQLSASSDAKAVRFDLYYSPEPGLVAPSWHLAGIDESPEDGFTSTLDTGQIPNQGLRDPGTVRVSATALDEGKTTSLEETRTIAISNPDPEGDYPYHVIDTCAEGQCKLRRRSGPGFSSYPSVGNIGEGEEVDIRCQARGESVSGPEGASEIWDELADGSWVSDYYLDTPEAGAFSPPIPECASIPEPSAFHLAFVTPASGQTLSGTVTLKAKSDAPGARFEALYSPSPGVEETAAWHQLGKGTLEGEYVSFAWNTKSVLNQGQPSQETIKIRVVGLDYGGSATAFSDIRRVNVANANSNGNFIYNVFNTCREGDCTANLHSGPGYSSYPVVGMKHENDEVEIHCQAVGETVDDGAESTNIWDELADGSWITDFYVDTPDQGSFSPPIPQC